MSPIGDTWVPCMGRGGALREGVQGPFMGPCQGPARSSVEAVRRLCADSVWGRAGASPAVAQQEPRRSPAGALYGARLEP